MAEAAHDEPSAHAVVWHDLECHGYTADLPLWRELAASPVLDVGAGTGRVALDLAARGHEVVALDRDPALLAEVARRNPAVRTVRAEAEDFDLGRRFGSILVPMQTVQLLGDRRAFLRCARAHLRPGGTLALALAEAIEPFDGSSGLPLPDVTESGGWRFASQPVAIRPTADGIRIERLRSAWGPTGQRTLEADSVELATLAAGVLEAEAAAAGFEPAGRRPIGPTDEHVGSVVVVLRG